MQDIFNEHANMVIATLFVWCYISCCMVEWLSVHDSLLVHHHQEAFPAYIMNFVWAQCWNCQEMSAIR